ncbi:MAG: hypothetical protein Tsb0014_04020 [Pleurocapsa sp.]
MNDDLATIPTTFAETIQLVENYVIEEIKQETQQKQLYYHTLDHALAVKRRAKIIFQAIAPVLDFQTQPIPFNRIENLISLCAISHDMVQQFDPVTIPHAPRKRLSGISERATVTKLITYIQSLNHILLTKNTDPSTRFNDLDLEILSDAIAATICTRDPLGGKTYYSLTANSIYQPYLYNSPSQQSIVGQILALADLGTLGMEGVETYFTEGVLILLEDNPDLVPLILNPNNAISLKPELIDAIKQRLLYMARFIVNLARERLLRFEKEIAGFNPDAQNILAREVFKYLTPENIKKVEELTPTDDTTSLKELLIFFRLD